MNINTFQNISFKHSYGAEYNIRTMDLSCHTEETNNDDMETVETWTKSALNFLQVADYLKSFLQADVNKIYVPSKDDSLDDIYSRMRISDIDKMENRELVALNVNDVENLFQKDDFYIFPNTMDISSVEFEDYLRTGRKIDAPTIVLSEDKDGVSVNFIDGRHRFSVLRDMGMPKMPFALDEESAEIAKKYGITASRMHTDLII